MLIQMKIGRNSLCWCGSGVKYKRCHLNSTDQKPLENLEIAKIFDSSFDASFCCVPQEMKNECSNKIVNAHTVPRSASLKRIARDSHVYALKFDYQTHVKKKDKDLYSLVGIGKASTFNGFCGFHDNKVFECVEKEGFSSSPRQCLALAYRAMCREYFMKYCAVVLGGRRFNLDRGLDLMRQVLAQRSMSAHAIGNNLGLRDSVFRKSAYEKAFFSDESLQRSCVLKLSDALPVMCSGVFCPEQDFHGNVLQSMAIAGVPACLSITSFYSDGCGYLVFTWLECDDSVCIPFVRPLLAQSQGDLLSACIYMIFSHIENIQISPDWWEALSEFDRRDYKRAFTSAVSTGEDFASGYLANFPRCDLSISLISSEMVGFSL